MAKSTMTITQGFGATWSYEGEGQESIGAVLVIVGQVDRSCCSLSWEKPRTRSWDPLPLLLLHKNSEPKKYFRAVHDSCLPASFSSLLSYSRVRSEFVSLTLINSRKHCRRSTQLEKRFLSAGDSGEGLSELFFINHKVPNMRHGTDSRFADCVLMWPGPSTRIRFDGDHL